MATPDKQQENVGEGGTEAGPSGTLVQVPADTADQITAAADQPEAKDVKEERPAYLEDLELDHDIEWVKQFCWLKILLILFGRWPITYSQDPQKRGYIFKFSWACPGSLVFFLSAIITLYGLVVSSVNIVAILMRDKITGTGARTKTQIIEQGLVERHTLIIIILLGSYGVNALTLFFIFVKRHQISETFTKWTRFLYIAKLNAGSKTYTYVRFALTCYMIFVVVCIVLTFFKTSATFIGAPTVVSIMSIRQFLPPNYLDKKFVGSTLHLVMHVLGIGIYFYVVTACNVYMYLFLWLAKSIENAFSSWNIRLLGVVEPTPTAAPAASAATGATPSTAASTTAEESKPSQNNLNPPQHPRLTYSALYHDHIGLVRMLAWFNNMFAYTLEAFILFLTVRIVYQMYLAALVMKSNGKPVNSANVGKYFIRKRDYIPGVLLTYENCCTMMVILLASSWLEDASYESYDELRRISLLKGSGSDNASFFFLSMFQSYTSTTKMSVYGGQYFCIDRYSILHVLSVIMSNFLVVYQFAPLFDMDTVEHPNIRAVMGKFLVSFEGLHPNHTYPLSDSHRNRIGY